VGLFFFVILHSFLLVVFIRNAARAMGCNWYVRDINICSLSKYILINLKKCKKEVLVYQKIPQNYKKKKARSREWGGG
jgi:hypothetical protein